MTESEVALIERKILNSINSTALQLFKSTDAALIFAGMVHSVFLEHGVSLDD